MIKTISQQILSVGKLIKSTKLQYEWVFSFNEKNIVVIFKESKISGKLEFLINNKIVAQKQTMNPETFKSEVELSSQLVISIKYQNENFRLYINGNLFDDYHSGKISNSGNQTHLTNNNSGNNQQVNTETFRKRAESQGYFNNPGIPITAPQRNTLYANHTNTMENPNVVYKDYPSLSNSSNTATNIYPSSPLGPSSPYSQNIYEVNPNKINQTKTKEQMFKDDPFCLIENRGVHFYDIGLVKPNPDNDILFKKIY